MSEKKKHRIIVILRAGLISLGVLFVIIGLLREEQIDVLLKAVRICLECIGIG